MDTSHHSWPIGELARRVSVALADGYHGPADNRVKGVPDVRAIRWYGTIGLLDKPGAYRGRTALYGPRHLRQLVAVKRRQAEGVPLARIQSELAGASDARLAQIADVADSLLTPEPLTEDAEPNREEGSTGTETAFWRARPTSSVDQAPTSYELVFGVPLAEGVTVLVNASHQPTESDVLAVREAAEPLLRALAARGLTDQGAQA